MFSNFLNFFMSSKLKYTKRSDDIYLDFVLNFSGQVFGNGIFRVSNVSELISMKNMVKEGFHELSDEVRVIGFDWLGRVFISGDSENEKIYMCDIGAHEILEIPTSFLDFVNKEIPMYAEEVLAVSFFNEWTKTGNGAPEYNECIGYQVPLFLGGADDVENLDKIDLNVYWSIMGQLGG